MSILRRIPFLALFYVPTPAEYAAKRTAEAEQMADHHRQKAIELGDQAAWCLAQRENHERMAAMYRARTSVVQMTPREVAR